APDLPAGLERVVGRALAKDPQRRYPDMAALLADLELLRRDRNALPAVPDGGDRRRRRVRWRIAVWVSFVVVCALAAWWLLGRTPGVREAEARESIGVLPLNNLSGDPEQKYFSDGMTDALLANLARIGALRVVSLMRHAEESLDIAAVAREFAVDHLLEGSVARDADRIRVTVKLIDAASRELLWIQDFDCDPAEVIALHNEVARSIAARIHVDLSEAERASLVEAPQIDPEAYELVLRGEQCRMMYDTEFWLDGVTYYEQATRLEPTYTPAWEGLAYCYFRLADHTGPVDDFYPQAKAAAERAIALDGSFSRAHATLGAILLLKHDWVGAEASFSRALLLGPNDPKVHGQYSTFLAFAGRFTEAIAEAKREAALAPLDTTILWRLAWTYLSARRYEQGVAESQRQLQRFPGMPASTRRGLHQIKAWNHMYLGDWEEVLAFCEEFAEEVPVAYLAHAGRRDEALARIDAAKRPSGDTPSGHDYYAYFKSYHVALDYADLGEADSTLAWLEKTADQCPEKLRHLNVDSCFDFLRGDPRLQEIIKRFSIPSGELARRSE
ncbi:MAG: hypothetical protein JXA90_10435, partial [Planctomycetes bacterium]|nr:hypothetical protein [Planctomycetota bacterium]